MRGARYAEDMRVRVLFFGVLRESFGAPEISVELASGTSSVNTLLARLHEQAGPAARALWPSLAVAVNREYAPGSLLLNADDEVALLPPVSGGAEDHVLLTTEPLEGREAVYALKAGADGAVVVFDGIVRDNTRGRRTLYLVYEAYETMALDGMRALVREARQRFAVRETLLHHRLGRLEIGETSVLIAVASAHRGAAFEACRWMIDTLKQQVPIWKREFFVDGAVWSDGEPFPEALRLQGDTGEHP